MPMYSKLFAAGLLSTCASATKLAAVSVEITPATATISAETTAATSNLVGGDNILSVPINLEVKSVGAGITATVAITTTTKNCVAEKPKGTLSLKMTFPAAFITALNVVNKVISTGVTGTALEKEYTFNLDGTDKGVDVSFNTDNMKMTGSSVNVKSLVKDVNAKSPWLAGTSLPLSLTITIMDPNKVEIPIPQACGKGSKICDTDDYGLALGGTSYTLAGNACKAMCAAVKSISSEAIFTKTLDVAALVKKAVSKEDAAKFFDGDNFLIGDSSAACVAPAATTPSSSTDALSGADMASIHTVAIVSLFSVALALFF